MGFLTVYLPALSEGIVAWVVPSWGPETLQDAWVALVRSSCRPSTIPPWPRVSTMGPWEDG